VRNDSPNLTRRMIRTQPKSSSLGGTRPGKPLKKKKKKRFLFLFLGKQPCIKGRRISMTREKQESELYLPPSKKKAKNSPTLIEEEED